MGLGIGRFVGAARALRLKHAVLVGAAVAVVAGGVSLGAIFAPDQTARAQTPPGYYDSTYAPSTLPGFRLSVQASTISPTDTSTLSAVYGSPSSPAAVAPSARITALARSLENDPDRIYQFVRNTILFEPQFGLHKGSDGVLLDGAGGAFDQSQLMIDLLRASNIDARYVLGTVSLGSEASTVLRVDSARQACLLLAAAGTPATVNTSTSCMSLSGPVTSVQMLHVWVEAQIGGSWYAFDPSLKTTTKTTGIDLWAAAGGTNAAAAWSNVSSGVSSGSSNLTGVNSTYIQNDVAAYATALQTTLINSHSDKSLEELTGGWEIVRTEAVLRNATLPGSSGSLTRWTGDVPAPYRATLQIETAGFNHTYDLASIYAWRTQAQIQGRKLVVAVRKDEHVDGSATAYFGNGCAVSNPLVVCGTSPTVEAYEAQARRLDLSINHPYAARRPGLDGGGQAWALGTFADEKVAKSIEAGKRVDILVRTAGGNGNRKAAWGAATDPIQQHRIIPAGDPAECFYGFPNNQQATAEACDQTQASDWTYWTQTSLGHPYGEVMAAEMGMKKDGVLNTWTDLFDKTVAVLEPLSGARIFHQHSVGVSLSPSYAENVLDIDTAVGIAPGGSDQPHHILSALAGLAATEEALAIGQMATERPMFQGISTQDNGPRRVASGAGGLKILTTAGSTSTLPASVSADTRARIEEYLNKGFSIVVTTTGSENAFLARRNDGSEQAWIIRSELGPQQAFNIDPRVAFRKGAETEVPNPLDYLGKAEARNIAANVAGTRLGAVDLRSGALSFGEGTEVSVGQGEFPYSLSFSRSYSSTGPVEGRGGLGMGWTHNWESSVSHSTDVGALLPDAEVVTAAPMLISALVALQAGRADTIEASAVAGVALDWLQAQASNNIVSVSGGGRSARFVRLVDGTWRNTASPTEQLTQVGSDPTHGTQFDWRLADRSVMAFRDINNPTAGQSDLNRHGALVSWTFPTGVIITLTYGGHNVTNSPSLTTVSNNLGAALTFTHSANPTPENQSACESNAAGIAYGGGQREAQQQCYEMGRMGGRLTTVSAGADQISFQYQNYCPKNVNFCAFTLTRAARPGLRERTYTYGTPTGALASASTPMEYQQVLTTVTDAGVSTPRARFDWRAVGGQVAPYVAEAFDAQDRKTVYYSSTFTYSAAKDAENAMVRQTYDEDGRLATSADGMGRIARATYDGPGRSRTVQTPYGDVTRFTYDLRGNLIKRRQEPIADCGVGFLPEQLAWWCQTIEVTAEYDSYWNKPTKITIPATAADPVTRDWIMTYNAQGLLATQTGPSVLNALTGNNAQPEWKTWYDAYGRVNRTQDPTGIETTQTWSTGGVGQAACLLQTVAPGPTPITTTFGCDAVGNVTTTTVAGFTTTTTYDALRRKTGETGPAGTAIQTQWLYDANGDQFQTNQWDSTAAQWRTTLTVFSATRQPLTVTDPESDVTRTCYDLVDRPVTVIDGERRATHTVYNAAGQPTEIHRFQRAAAGSCSISTELPPNAGFSETRWRRFLYNAGGLQSAEIDARGNTTQQVYDGLGRPARTIFPDVDGAGPIPAARAWTATDQRGQAIFRKQRSGFRASVFYDAVGRDFHVREYLEADKANQWTGRNSRASYDLAGRPIWRDVSTQTTTSGTFDDALRRDVRTYGYTAGVLTADQWQPEGIGAGKPTLSFAYGYADGRGNRTSVSWPVAAGQPAWTASYVFDAANRASSVSFPGAGGTQTVALTYDSLSRRTGINRPGAAADTTYTYDPDSDLASMSHAFVPGTGPGPLSFAYSHDAAGKTTSINIDQPAFEWMPSMAYARSYGVANPLNQVASEGGVAIVVNVDGNMTSDGVNTYEWTFGNRLVRATRVGMTATYDYDSDDRRTRKIVDGTMTRTMWSGADEMAEVNDAGVVLRRFIPDGSGAMDGRLATVENDGAPQTVYWHHTDHQGSVVATSNSAGQTVGIANYSPYGEFGGTTTIPPPGSPFGYTGRQFDPETGLYQYRARYYSPRLGQFLSTDPVGTKDDPNLYVYVANDPANATDPTGMLEVRSEIAPRAEGAARRQMARFMSTAHGRDMYLAAERSPTVYTINADFGLINEFIPETNTINWDPRTPFTLDSGETQSPAVTFGHELSHGLERERIGTVQFRRNLRWGQGTSTTASDGTIEYTPGSAPPEEERATDEADIIARALGEPERRRYLNDGYTGGR